jgi:hypothetical protein
VILVTLFSFVGCDHSTNQTPASQTPATQTPAAQTPASQTPDTQTPATPAPGEESVSLSFQKNSNTASGSMTTLNGAPGSSVTIPQCSFSNSGYSFVSWNTLSNGNGTSYAPGSSYTLPSTDSVLYAQWTVNTPSEDGWYDTIYLARYIYTSIKGEHFADSSYSNTQSGYAFTDYTGYAVPDEPNTSYTFISENTSAEPNTATFYIKANAGYYLNNQHQAIVLPSGVPQFTQINTSTNYWRWTTNEYSN